MGAPRPWSAAGSAREGPVADRNNREGVDNSMRLKLLALCASVAAGIWLVAASGVSSAGVSHGHGIPRYNHIVEIMMENTSYPTIIGNSFAPNLNALANRYGLATDYFGVTHPS